MGDPRSLLSTALSPPNLSDIVRTVLQLIEASKAVVEQWGFTLVKTPLSSVIVAMVDEVYDRRLN